MSNTNLDISVEEVRLFILRTYLGIKDIDLENTIKMVKGENYEYVSENLALTPKVLCRGRNYS